MSRKVLGVWLVSILVLIGYGNACSRNFQFTDDELYASLNQTCRQDESHLSGFKIQDYTLGYLGQKPIHYIPQYDDWILVDGDRLLNVKGGRLPDRPLDGISQGVGVRAGGRWPGGVIPYDISPSLTDVQRVTEAVNHWNANLTGVIRLVPRTTQSDYLRFNPSNSGCAAPIGYLAGYGQHPINISTACHAGNVAHEIGHIVGLDHEQNRLDRDSYVTIQTGNLTAGVEDNFAIDPSNQNYNFYDFGSLMHYSLDAFSFNGQRTIVPKVAIPSGVFVGQRNGLSVGDINSVRIMYGFPPLGATSEPGTLNGSQGLFGRYYEGSDFGILRAERIDPNINFNWGAGSPIAGVPEDDFSVRWTGYLVPPADGVYTFRVEAMDPLKVTIEDIDIFKMTGGNTIREAVSIPYELTGGFRYPIMIDYSATEGNSYFRIYWKKDGVESIIPGTVFVPNTDSSGISGCSSKWLTAQ